MTFLKHLIIQLSHCVLFSCSRCCFFPFPSFSAASLLHYLLLDHNLFKAGIFSQRSCKQERHLSRLKPWGVVMRHKKEQEEKWGLRRENKNQTNRVHEDFCLYIVKVSDMLHLDSAWSLILCAWFLNQFKEIKETKSKALQSRLLFSKCIQEAQVKFVLNQFVFRAEKQSTTLRHVVRFKNVRKILKLMELIRGCIHWAIQGMSWLISLQSVTKMSHSERKHFHSLPGFFSSKWRGKTIALDFLGPWSAFHSHYLPFKKLKWG